LSLLPALASLAYDAPASVKKGYSLRQSSLIPVETIEKTIYLIRGQRVMLDADLALLYQVTTKALNHIWKKLVSELSEPTFLACRCRWGNGLGRRLRGIFNHRGAASTSRGAATYL